MERYRQQGTDDNTRIREGNVESINRSLDSEHGILLGWTAIEHKIAPEGLGDERLHCTEEQLVIALTGRAQPMHREVLALKLERLQLIDRQIAKLNGIIAQAMKPYQEAVIRLAEVPGSGSGSGAG
jgi:hypothetical protein